MKKTVQIFTAIIILSMVLAGCTLPSGAPDGQPSPGVTPQMAARPVQVQSVTMQLLQSKPVGVVAVVRGSLSESCATLQSPQVQYGNSTFAITLQAVSPTDRGCAQATTPFETTVPLDVHGLPAGNYTVIANGVSAVFTLTVEGSTTAPTASGGSTPVSSSGGSCTDAAAFVTDLSIPDNFQVAPGTVFTKIWRVKNTGTCTWNSNYVASYLRGAAMTQWAEYVIMDPEERVAPGQTVDVTISMRAPLENGTYTSYWGLKGRQGQFMPVAGGSNGNSFFVKINVDNGEPHGGKIVAQSVDIQLANGSSPACSADAEYVVYAKITADGPITVQYELLSTAGQIPAGYFVGEAGNEKSVEESAQIVFVAEDALETQTVTYGFVGPYPYPDNITIQVRTNGGPWTSVKVICP